MSIKINTLEIENVKRVKAVAIAPEANGLTIIGGRNNQGKTSVLGAIAGAFVAVFAGYVEQWFNSRAQGEKQRAYGD